MTSSSASAERRKRLKEAESQNGHSLQNVSDSFPIEKYFTMSDRLLVAFGLALDERRLDDAYVFGLRFATFSLEGIPKHSGYKSARYKMLRLKNSRNVEDVLNKMASVTTRMDAEELVLARRRKEAIETRRRAEAQCQQEEAQQEQAEVNKDKRHAAILQQQREELRAIQREEQQAKQVQTGKKQQQGVANSALEKLRLLSLQTKGETSIIVPSEKQPEANVIKPTTGTQEPKKSSLTVDAPKPEITNKKSRISKLSPKKKSTSKQQVVREPTPVAPVKAANSTPKKNSKAPVSQASKKGSQLEQSSMRKLLQLTSKTTPSIGQVTATDNSSSSRSASKPVGSDTEVVVPPKSQPAAPAAQSTSKRSLFQHLSPKKKQPGSKSKLKVSSYSSNANSEGHEVTTPSSRSIEVSLKQEPMLPTESPSPYQTNLTASEARALKLLADTIKLQENRLETMEHSKEPVRLRQEAKLKLKNGDKKGALRILAKKKRFHRMMDVTKHAIFNMETQMIMLESAVENREISKILKESNDVVCELQGGVPLSPIEDICTEQKLNDILATLNYSEGTDIFDEEELLSELQEPSEGAMHSSDDNSLLSLPSLPANPAELELDTPVAQAKSLLASLF